MIFSTGLIVNHDNHVLLFYLLSSSSILHCRSKSKNHAMSLTTKPYQQVLPPSITTKSYHQVLQPSLNIKSYHQVLYLQVLLPSLTTKHLQVLQVFLIFLRISKTTKLTQQFKGGWYLKQMSSFSTQFKRHAKNTGGP